MPKGQYVRKRKAKDQDGASDKIGVSEADAVTIKILKDEFAMIRGLLSICQHKIFMIEKDLTETND